MQVTEILRTAKEHSGMSSYEIAELSGVSEATISRILSGKNIASQFLHCWIALIPIKVSGIIAIIKSVWKAVVKH